MLERNILVLMIQKSFSYLALACLLVHNLEAKSIDRPKDITIVGGAGPQAGIMLADMIVRACQIKWGCQNDGDFPYIQLLSYPFSDMLSLGYSDVVAKELEFLVNHELTIEKTKAWVIACNTLHIYADKLSTGCNFTHIMEVTRPYIKDRKALILCTSASRKEQIHAKYLNAAYPEDIDDQRAVDEIILSILSGELDKEFSRKLEAICLKYPECIPVLGCTELSLLQVKHPLSIPVVDPCEILSEKLATDWYLSRLSLKS